MSEDGEIVIRCSSLPPWPDCERRSAAIMFPVLVEAAGFTLQQRRSHIGGVVGSAVHTGAGYMLTEKIDTGEVGNETEAVDRAETEMKRRLDEAPIVFDATTEKVPTAQKQIARMVRTYRRFAEGVDPEAVEYNLRADLGDGFILSGHGDAFTRIDAGLRDLKTGTLKRMNAGQYGGYSVLARANQMPVVNIYEDYLKRVRVSKEQPPVETVEIDQESAEHQAMDTMRRIKRAVQNFQMLMDKGSDRPERAFQANPLSMLCSEKFCPAFGSDFCKVHKRETE